MRVRLKSKIALLSLIVAFATSLVSGQQAAVTKRKVKTRVDPAFPELARKLNISGKVRVEVVIAADGHVQTVRAVGGSPVLVQPCLNAVKEWRFLVAQEETTEVIEFTFDR
jgi:TonB family protein